MYIACPRCDWRPDASARWSCTCGHSWNTFQTHGVCPACARIWRTTQCITYAGCGQWSDHEEWYHDDDAPTVEEYIETMKGIEEPAPAVR